MINAQGRLLVIEDFQVDRTLPKFRKRKKDPSTKFVSMSKEEAEESHEETFWNPEDFGSSNLRMNQDGSRFLIQANSKPAEPVPWYKRWFSSAKPAEPVPTLSVEDFFKSVKNSAQELVVVQARAAGYEAALLNAKKAGQKALFEKLSGGLNAFRMETQLIALGLTRYINEEDIVRFYKQSKKGLRLDWVRNFTRPIPEEVTARKVRADDLGIFDNYAVLHYDPQAKAFSETKAEVAARKDPILFGLMQDRTQLYVIGDWIDETCDLTLDQFAEVLGAGAVQTIASGPPT